MQDIINSQIADAQSPEAVFTLLSDRRRRNTVDVLSDQETAVTLRKLVDSVAVRETETDDVPDATIDAVATSLHHVHLPKLDEADVVDYDHETHIVTPRDTDELAKFVDSSSDGR